MKTDRNNEQRTTTIEHQTALIVSKGDRELEIILTSAQRDALQEWFRRHKTSIESIQQQPAGAAGFTYQLRKPYWQHNVLLESVPGRDRRGVLA